VSGHYFNYSRALAKTRGERRGFLKSWWWIFANDPRWVPPYYPAMGSLLEAAGSGKQIPGHLGRMRMQLVQLTALPRRATSARESVDLDAMGRLPQSIGYESPVAAAILLSDPRRRDKTGYLVWPHFVNDEESFERLLNLASEVFSQLGCRRMIGPTGFSPYLENGMLVDHWRQLPPLYTPYNPPYLPEIAHQLLDPIHSARLFHLAVPPQPLPLQEDHFDLLPLQPERLAADLLPLFASALLSTFDAPELDAAEAEFLVQRVGDWPLSGWLAQVDGQPAGFVLLQSDFAPPLKRSKGGRNLFWRLWLNRTARRSTMQGRLLFGGVLPSFRRQGLGAHLLQRALQTAQVQGWQHLTIGPIPDRSLDAVNFLVHHGAQPQQKYQVFSYEF